MQRHHYHACNPEKDDVVTGHQHVARQVNTVFFEARLIGPAKGRVAHQRRREPRVEHVGVAGERFATALFKRLCLAARNVDFSVGVIPRRDLMTPPQLPRNTPVANVAQPVVVGARPVLRIELYIAVFDRIQRSSSQAASVLVGWLAHGNEPLIGQHRLDGLAGALAGRHHAFMWHGFLQKLLRFQVTQHRLACLKPVKPLIQLWAVFVDFCV